MTRIAVITGASGGVGRAVARELAARGYDLALLARGHAGLAGAAEEVRAAGRRVLALPTDMADWDQVRDAARQVEAELGPMDVWINVAFTSVFARFTDIDPKEYRRVTEVSYLGYVHGTRAALDVMLPRDHGAIVQVGSTLAYRGIPLQTAYCGAKHAIQGFHESLRCELLHDKSNVHTTMVQLPAVNTPQFDWVLNKLPHRAQPVPPIYQPEVIARTVAHAAEHPQRREYWCGETTALTLIANAVAPGLLDRYLARAGFASQQTDQPTTSGAPVNLWEPADDEPGTDRGAHGRFDARSLSRSPQAWLSRHHRSGAAGLAVLAVGLAMNIGRR
jgi:NAD(P)-dependent dehydrogenase (short-subunit alcohol dehydrogenase family)